MNNKYLEFLNEKGIKSTRICPEANSRQVSDLLNNNFNTEMLIYGKLTTMLIELDLYKILNIFDF